MSQYVITPTGVTKVERLTVPEQRGQVMLGNHVVLASGEYIERPMPSPAMWREWDTHPIITPDEKFTSRTYVYDQDQERPDTWWGRFKTRHIIADDPTEGR